MALYNVACCFRHGDGVKKNKLKAIKWYEKAAEAGSCDALLSLGFMYERGEGVNAFQINYTRPANFFF